MARQRACDVIGDAAKLRGPAASVCLSLGCIGRGAQGSTGELDNIVNYLSANFGKGNASASNAAPCASCGACALMAAGEGGAVK